MSGTTNEIVFLGVKPKRSFERFVEKQVMKWIHTRLRPFSATEPYSFHVMIQRDEVLPLATCQIRVEVDSRHWESQESEKSIQLALLRAIRGLRPCRSKEYAECAAA